MLDARRRACLEAMGIELWRVREGASGDRRPRAAGAASFSDMVPDPQLVDVPPERPAPRDAAEAMGGAMAPPSPVAPSANVEFPVAPASRGEPRSAPSAPASVASLGWDELRAAVGSCQACALHETRTQTVFGVGDPNARLMVIGEAPGADEDRQGEPFVGRAGQLLNAMLAAIGFAREQVFIANIIKCRPPGNRDPHAEEAAACQAFLHRQIALIQPQLILSVGRISAQNLLGTEEAVGRLRGRSHRFEPGGIPLIVTYHPAYLLRRPQEKAKAWQDLQAAYRALNGK